jgi:hypothetical protein
VYIVCDSLSREKELLLISVGTNFGGRFSLVSTQLVCFLNAFSGMYARNNLRKTELLLMKSDISESCQSLLTAIVFEVFAVLGYCSGLFGWLVVWLVRWFVRSLVGSLVGWLAGWLVGSWLVGWLVVWMVGWLVGGWLVGWWLVGSFVRWLVGWLVGGWLVRWLVRSLVGR